MTAEQQEIVGLQRVYRGVCEGVAIMPDGCASAKSLAPLIRDLAYALACYATDDDGEGGE